MQFALLSEAGEGAEKPKVRPQERRQHRRARLRLPVSRLALEGEDVAEGMWTSDVSAGGMYLRAPASVASRLPVGARVSFELNVPPGGGYWASAGRVRGAGRVVRAEQLDPDAVGVAVEFSHALSINFDPPPG